MCGLWKNRSRDRMSRCLISLSGVVLVCQRILRSFTLAFRLVSSLTSWCVPTIRVVCATSSVSNNIEDIRLQRIRNLLPPHHSLRHIRRLAIGMSVPLADRDLRKCSYTRRQQKKFGGKGTSHDRLKSGVEDAGSRQTPARMKQCSDRDRG